MRISIEHFTGKFPQFNVSLSTEAGKDPFIVIKGCRIVNGSKGEFISWPATKNESTGKYWNHVYASDGFNAAVLAEAKKNLPEPDDRTHGKRKSDLADGITDVPF